MSISRKYKDENDCTCQQLCVHCLLSRTIFDNISMTRICNFCRPTNNKVSNKFCCIYRHLRSPKTYVIEFN
jgi:hypothetical protein